MTNLFLLCAGLGTLVLVIQAIAGAVGTHHDFGHHEDDGGLFFGILSVRAIAAAFAAFGIAGMAAHRANLGDTRSLTLGGLGAAAAIGFVVLIMRGMRRLSASGTVESRRAVDQIGRVYVAVPAKFGGQGKVQVDVMNRTLEMTAVTAGPALETGTRVRVVQLVDEGTAEVIGVGMG